MKGSAAPSPPRFPALPWCGCILHCRFFFCLSSACVAGQGGSVAVGMAEGSG